MWIFSVGIHIIWGFCIVFCMNRNYFIKTWFNRSCLINIRKIIHQIRPFSMNRNYIIIRTRIILHIWLIGVNRNYILIAIFKIAFHGNFFHIFCLIAVIICNLFRFPYNLGIISYIIQRTSATCTFEFANVILGVKLIFQTAVFAKNEYRVRIYFISIIIITIVWFMIIWKTFNFLQDSSTNRTFKCIDIISIIQLIFRTTVLTHYYFHLNPYS